MADATQQTPVTPAPVVPQVVKSATVIPATKPLTVPATTAVVYDQWFMTQLVGRFSPTSGPLTVTLQRAAVVNGSVVLAPNNVNGNSVTVNVDIVKQMANNPAMETAMQAVVAAVQAYATAQNLL